METERRPIPLATLVPRAAGGRLGRLQGSSWPEPLPAHVGLWLDRVLALPSRPSRRSPEEADSPDEGHPERLRLYQVAAESLRLGDSTHPDPPAIAAYRPLFARWRRQLEKETPGIVRRLLEVEAHTRLLLHPATQETVTEGTVLLHHTYGVPYLPGSGLKGVLRRRLRSTLPEEQVEEILGRQHPERGDLASAVDLLDALWIPQRPHSQGQDWSPLALDVVTPHHPGYMTVAGDARSIPTDADEPIPVHRLTVAPGARFLVVLEAPGAALPPNWLDLLLSQALLPALEEDGFGAWTSVGYGRLGALGGVSSKPRSGAILPGSTGEAEPLSPPGWLSATVTRDRGNGRLTAYLADDRRAEAQATQADALLKQLPPTVVERLRRKGKQKPVPLEAQIERQGTSWKLTGLREPGGGE